jgi:hypothetical protein
MRGIECSRSPSCLSAASGYRHITA